MSVADCRAARRKMILRYRHARGRDVQEAIEAEKRKAAGQDARKKKRSVGQSDQTRARTT